jgi:hypothetical protein
MPNFSIFASLRSEFTLLLDLAFSPSPGIKHTIFFYCFFQRILKRALDSSKNSMYEASESRDWNSLHLANFSAKKTYDLHP